MGWFSDKTSLAAMKEALPESRKICTRVSNSNTVRTLRITDREFTYLRQD